MFYNGIFISETSPRECERGAEARREMLGHEELWRGGATVERRGVTGGSGVQGVKTLSTEKRNTCIHRATLALPAL